MEANPFHNGHTYFINEVIRAHHPDVIIVVTSTSFSMRGDISVLSKFEKTKQYLNNFCNLVFEIPITKSLQSANNFARSAIEILEALQVTDLAFGSEISDIETLYKLISIYDSNEYKEQIKLAIKQNGLKHSSIAALKILDYSQELIKCSALPNVTLGIEYLKATKIKKEHIHIIKRTTNYYQKSPTIIQSATFLRNEIIHSQNISKYINYELPIKDFEKSYELLFALAKYEFFKNNISDSEGIFNYLKNKIMTTNNYFDFLNIAANKKYSRSFINRYILHFLLGNNTYNNDLYLRLLGFDDVGINYLNSLPKSLKKQIFSSPKELSFDSKNLDTELLATRLYSLLLKDNNLFIEEYKLPIRKDSK